jgi:hypothetical protein
VAALLAIQLGREAPSSALAIAVEVFALEACKFAQNTSDHNERVLFLLIARVLCGAAKDEPQFVATVHDILLSATEALGADPARDNPPSNRSSWIVGLQVTISHPQRQFEQCHKYREAAIT